MDLFDRLRDSYYGWFERQFPSPVQVRLIEILGGTTITIGSIRHRNVPMTLTLSRGRLLRSKRFRRAVLDGQGVLANDVRWAVQIMGPEYERDVVAAFERDERLEAEGWHLAYVNMRDIWNNPAKVRKSLLPFFDRAV